jgi:glycosyltransferase involved in cell wall biosynthesis
MRRQSMKILHVITGLRRGGAEGVLTRLVCTRQPEFEHVVVALLEEDYYGPILRAAGIAVQALRIGGDLSVLRGLASLARLIRREQPTIVQTWLYHADLLGGIAARLSGVRAVVWAVRNTNLDAQSISRSTHLVARATACLSRFVPAVVVFNSHVSMRTHAAFGYRPRSCRVIANGCDVERFRPDAALRNRVRAQLGVSPGELLVGNVARWDPQKDHANLLAAFAGLVPRGPGPRIVLVGEGMQATNERLVTLIREAGLQDRTILGGARDDVPAIMNALDVHVLSSSGEAFPNVVAEAMACGTPCVVTDVGDAGRIVGDTGWVVPPRNPKALSTALEEALETVQRGDPALLGQRCRARIVENFAMQPMVDAFGALWRELSRDTVRV